MVRRLRRLSQLLVTAVFPLHSAAGARALELVPVLPAGIAMQAAVEALNACTRDGYRVAVTVVNQEGNVVAALRSEQSGVHTLENSFNKAYTVISVGRSYGLDSTAEIVRRSQGGQAPGIGSFPLPASPLRGLSYSAGGLAIKARGTLIGAIGVSGSPSGAFDQACAARGLQLLQPHLQ